MASNLAKSDTEGRILRDFDQLLAVTRDERFVTACHCLQALWKVGAVNPEHQQLVVERLAARFHEAERESADLLRQD